jgi:predicted transcriptional regulator
MRPRKTTYKVTYSDKFALGEAYYRIIKDTASDMSKTALKCLLLIHIARGKEVLTFKLGDIPYKTFWSNDTMLDGVRELVKSGYLEKETRQTYKLNDKGTELTRLFWWRHSRKFAKLVNDDKGE